MKTSHISIMASFSGYNIVLSICIMVWNIPLSDQAMHVFGIYIGLLLLLIILGVALMYLCYKVCNKRYQQSADEKEPNEKSYLLVSA